MTVDTSKIRAYTNGLVAVGGYNSSPTLPTDATTPLNAGLYTDCGTVTDDGITDTTSQDYNDVFMWQGNALAASIPGQFTKTFKVACMEQSLINLGVQYPGSTITQTAYGVSIAEKPPTIDKRVWVFHGISDAGRLQRVIVPIGQVTDRGDVVWKSTEVTVYEWTIKCFLDVSGNVAYRYLVDPSMSL